ncbi:sulfite exporter TauE/SafE family protein [Desulforamulus aquiferis]|uniref:Probable membrane transporter protein n=1 Tax=Desulforamulus aquiferis TaxID=1397668 RepID=A0AAW7ZG27_9FIRM|nr:sulfite exporter TauE/SafE family protein [Desulforamulus aquiferis]MDO7788749.1 sulfite exporter TauE/SafE family protein [Desulforamulus aquiferis]
MENLIFSGSITFMILGMLVGFLINIVGNTGALAVMPLLIIFLGFPPEAALPIALGHLAAVGVPGLVLHWQTGNVDLKLIALVVIGVAPGIWLGKGLSTSSFYHVWGLYLVLVPYLILMLAAVIHRYRPFAILPKPNNRYRKMVLKFIKKIPGRIYSDTSGTNIPIIVPLITGVLLGLTGKILGPLATIIIAPILIVILNIPVIVAMGTAVTVNFIASLSIAVTSGLVSIPLNLQILLWTFLGSSLVLLLVSSIWRKHSPYPIPVATVLVLITSITLWAVTSSQPNLDFIMQHFSLPGNVLGWLGGVKS